MKASARTSYVSNSVLFNVRHRPICIRHSLRVQGMRSPQTGSALPHSVHLGLLKISKILGDFTVYGRGLPPHKSLSPKIRPPWHIFQIYLISDVYMCVLPCNHSAGTSEYFGLAKLNNQFSERLYGLSGVSLLKNPKPNYFTQMRDSLPGPTSCLPKPRCFRSSGNAFSGV